LLKPYIVLVDGGEMMFPNYGQNRPVVYPPTIYEYEEPRWNDIVRGKLNNSNKNLFQPHFVHHKSHMDRPGHELDSSQLDIGD
jgi:hypothetical protein